MGDVGDPVDLLDLLLVADAGSGLMIETLSITISRSGPAMSTPMLNAARIAIRTPNSRNATKIDSRA